MSQSIRKIYNTISDVFSKEQIKAAVEELIDHIIDRREEIEKSEDIFKMKQYAHIFKRMLNKFRQKKDDQEFEKKQEKMEIIMQLFRSEKTKKPNAPNSNPRQLLQGFKGRDHSEPATYRSIATQSTKAEQNLINSSNNNKSETPSRLLTERNPQQEGDTVEQDIYNFLSTSKRLSMLRQEKPNKAADSDYQMKRIANKIKHEMIEQENILEVFSAKKAQYVKNAIHRNFYYQGSEIKILKSISCKPIKTKYIKSIIKNVNQKGGSKFADEQSFASYTEIKLNQLYQDSIDKQQMMRQQFSSSAKNSILKQHIVQINKNIISVSNSKIYQFKQLQKIQ